MHFLLEEFHVLPINLDGQSIQIHSLSHSILHSRGLLLDLLVLADDMVLDFDHLIAVPLNRCQLVIRLSYLNIIEYLQDFIVLVLHVDEAHLLALVLSHEVDQITTLLNLVETLDKLVSKVVNPLHELLFDLDQGVTDALLPLLDDGLVALILCDGLLSVGLD